MQNTADCIPLYGPCVLGRFVGLVGLVGFVGIVGLVRFVGLILLVGILGSLSSLGSLCFADASLFLNPLPPPSRSAPPAYKVWIGDG